MKISSERACNPFITPEAAADMICDYRYLRALAAFYIRLTFSPVEIYKTLEPFLADYRKVKRRTRNGYTITYIDQFIDELLTKDRVCSTSLWKLPRRQHFEDLDQLDERISPLGAELDDIDVTARNRTIEVEPIFARLSSTEYLCCHIMLHVRTHTSGQY